MRKAWAIGSIGIACWLACGSFGNAATQKQIDVAIKKGVAYLRSTQTEDGSWSYGGHVEGATSLAGLALLESKVPANDAALTKASTFVYSRVSTCGMTYSIALSIMFLDRHEFGLGNRYAVPQVSWLGKRLLHGQFSDGSWSYTCPEPRADGVQPLASPGRGDNSNTQFAILGCWVSRRHGVDVGNALQSLDTRFRATQGEDGGWNYTSPPPSETNGMRLNARSTPSMTCAGLLALAAQMGYQQISLGGAATNQPGRTQQPAAKPAQGPAMNLKDPAIVDGLACLAGYLTTPGSVSNSDLYFAWSVERVGVTYGLTKIGTVDWYQIGADTLVKTQAENGSWNDNHGATLAGTSFALLFLNRANLAEDLSTVLAGQPSDALSARPPNPNTMRGGMPGVSGMGPRGPLPGAGPVPLPTLPPVSPADLKSLAWPALLTRLDGARDPAVQAEIDRRYESFTYRDIKADVSELARLNRGTKPSAAAARQALEEAFTRAPISDSLRWLADADAALKSLIWERLTARIDAADDERRASYLNWSSQVLTETGEPLVARLAAIEFLGKLPRRGGVKALVQGLKLKEASLRLACADALRKITGEKYGPRAGDGETALTEAIKQWEAWLAEHPD